MKLRTRKLDLRTGKSVWSAYRKPRIVSRPLEENQTADAVVLGAGISGAMIAEQLSEAGLSVIILDRRGPMKGSTAASTALLQYAIDTPLTVLSRKIGAKNAAHAWRRSKLSLESLAAKIRQLEITCAYERRNTLYLAGDLLDATALKKERTAQQNIGLTVDYLNRAALQQRYGISRAAALHSYDDVAVNPVQLTAGFLDSALNAGAKLYAPAEATKITPVPRSVKLTTANGISITCRHLVFATGYELPQQLRVKDHTICSTWAIATKPQPRNFWQEQAFIWEASEPYLYIRATADGRVICGGEDEEFADEATRDALSPRKTATLSKKLSHLFPHLDTAPEFAWTGCFGVSSTGLPKIGRIPGMPNCFAALAYGGNGITFSRIAAELIATAISGQHDPDEDLFAF